MEGQGDRDPLARSAIESAMRAVAENAGPELSSLLGVPVEIDPLEVDGVAAESVAESDDPIVVVLCRGEGASDLSLQLVVPRPLGAILAGLQQGRSLAEIEPATRDPLDPEALGGLRGALRIVVSALEPALAEALAGGLAIRDALEVDEPASDPTWLDGSSFWRARLGVRLEGTDVFPLDLLFPRGEDESAGQGATSHRLLVIDADPADEELIALGRELRCTVDVLGAERLRRRGVTELVDADAIVIPWDLAGTPGLDLVERLSVHEAVRGKPLILTHAHPTRAMVLAALAAGATSFAMLPLAADELRERIGLAQTGDPSPELEAQ
jgi:CheY-like chemotaxis protein